jgi:hypothetical protein
VHASGPSCNQAVADSGANYAMGPRYRQFEKRGYHQPNGAGCQGAQRSQHELDFGVVVYLDVQYPLPHGVRNLVALQHINYHN